MKKIFNSKKGFSLVEMLLYMGLLSILLVVMVDLFASSLDLQLESQSTTSVNRDARFLFSRLSYDINRAQSIVSPSLGAQGSSLQLTIGGVNYTYAQNNGNLQLTNNNGTDNLNSYGTTISNLSFRTVGNVGGKHSVRISFTLTSTTERVSGPETKNIETTIGLR